MSKKRIFIAEDNETLRRGYLRILSISKKYDVEAFASATDLLVALEGCEKPDLILTDNDMPGMTGTELVAYLHKVHFNTPIIMISGSDKAQNNKVLMSQLNAFLPKPSPIRQLIEAVESALAS